MPFNLCRSLRQNSSAPAPVIDWIDVSSASNAEIHRLFIGYCAEGTLGDQTIKGKSPVNIFGDPYPVRARVVSVDTYSGHADRTELKRYVQQIGGDIRRIFCIHGEESQCLAHAETLRELKPAAQILVPEYEQVVEV